MIKDEFSTFKRHSAWFSQRASATLHETPARELEDFWKQRAQSPGHSKLPKWECLGPFNIAGRVTSLIAHPAHPHHLWAGAAAGGVWSSTNGGATLEKLLAALGQSPHRRAGLRPRQPRYHLLRHRRSQHLPRLLPRHRPLHQPRWRCQLGVAGGRRHPPSAVPHRRSAAVQGPALHAVPGRADAR